MSRLARVVALLVATAALAGCTLFDARPAGGSTCAAQFSTGRCDALLLWAADQLAVEPGRIDRIDIAPPTPVPELRRGEAVPLIVRVAGGATHELTLQCSGPAGADYPPCMAEPELRVFSMAFDRDVPEGSTPLPELQPAAVAGARPLVVDRVVIPVAAIGRQHFTLGRAGLANGVVQGVTGALEDTWPNNVLVRGGVEIQLIPVDGGEPIGNAYVQGWRPGVQEVDVVVVFDAAIIRPGAELVLVDVDVR